MSGIRCLILPVADARNCYLGLSTSSDLAIPVATSRIDSIDVTSLSNSGRWHAWSGELLAFA